MPFDLEDVLPGLDVPRFEATPANAQQPDDVAGVVHCNCPVCSGALSVIEGTPTDPQNFLNAEERGGTGDNNKPSLTIPEAAVQLNRSYASWNDFNRRPGVPDENNRWDDPHWGGAPSIVTFAFRSTAPSTGMPDDTGGFSQFTSGQIAAALLALQSWADVANVVFTRVGAGTTGAGAYSNNATILFGNYATGSDGAAAFAYYPSMSDEGGDVWVNYSLTSNKNPAQGNYGMLTLVHEIGHAIGFSHPGEYNAGEGDGPITYSADAEYYEDSQQYTVMSYFTENNTGANYGVYYPAAPQLDDIAAAQRTYGVNTTTRTGDTIYGFNATADRPWFSITVGSSVAVVFAVWDAGGIDTFDFSGYGQNQKIDLQQGHFSNVGSWIGNVAIAIGAVIENAIGGSGADTLIGNSAANRLTGNGGADTLTGGAGADIFVVTTAGGTDTVTDFTVGSDKIDLTAFGAYASITQSGLNTVVAFTGGVSITLLNVTASTVTNASFVGLPSSYNVINGTAGAETINGTAAADQIFGLGGNDILNGAGADDWLEGGADNDTLNGGAGADTMKGGTGNDTYVVDNVGDLVTELAGEGTDTVQTGLADYTLGADVENLTGTASTGQALTGNGLANVINGGAGADTLDGGAGADTLAGGSGNDIYYVDNAGDVVTEFASDGADTVRTTLASYTLAANVETLTGVALTAQTLVGNGQDNVIGGGSGNDTLTGGAGWDTFLVKSGGGQDVITDFAGNERIDSSALGALQTVVQSGADTLVTYAGGVTIRLLGIDATTLRNYNFVQGSVGAAPAGFNQITGTTGANTLTGLNLSNRIQGLEGNDAITGGNATDWLEGGAGNDTITGGTDTDYLFGGEGDDILSDIVPAGDGLSDQDFLDGGAGNDTYYIAGSDQVIEAVGGGIDTVHSYGYYVTLAENVEILILENGAHQAEGNALANTITINAMPTSGTSDVKGLGGDDILSGNAGANFLDGGDGADTLYGGAGADNLQGSDGNDVLVGGEGDDGISGGAGADTVVMTLNGGADQMWDFEVGIDKIDVTAFGGYQSISQQGGNALVTLASGVTILLLDVTASSLTAADFIGLGGPVYNTINGTTGADTLNGTGAADHILGLAGVDTLNGAAGKDWLEGGDSNDTLNGDAGDDLLWGGAGVDTINGGDGADTIRGDAGNDILVGGAGLDVFVATVGGGNDQINDFVVGLDKIDATAFGGYQSIVQSGADTVVTFAAGVSMTLKGVTASTLTDSSFIGVPVFNVITGTAFGDTLNGTSVNDRISGLEGNDTLSGFAGADLLEGGDGNDLLSGGIGSDTMRGGIGDDTYEVDSLADIVEEAADAGTDTIRTQLSSYTLAANFENLEAHMGFSVGQALTGNSANNVITGAGGADTLTGGAGTDTLTGAGGADVFVVTVGGGADTVTDFVVGTDRIDVSAFGAYQTIVQSGADTLITVAAGVTLRLIGITASTVTNASFIGLPSGPNVITGTTGANTLNGTAGADHIFALAGNDTVHGLGGDDWIEGAEGLDKLYGDDGADKLEGGDGNDTLDGGIGADALIGGLGDDIYVVDNAGDVVTEAAGAGTDVVQTTLTAYTLGANVENLTGTLGSAQTLTGNTANNVITGGAGSDTLAGLDGDDRLFGGLGADALDGGLGIDTLYGDDGNDSLTGGAGIDNLYGGADNDTLTGGADLDRLYGEDGDDTLSGDDGNDVLQGAGGVDRITGGAGNDTVTGGDGADVFVATLGGGADTVMDFVVGADKIDLAAFGGYLTIAQSSADTLITFATGVTMRLKGITASTVTNDSFIGLTPGYNLINGTAAGETLNGTAAADHIVSLGGADTLNGAGADDWLEGGEGDDTLNGGAGGDLLTGGAGADVFVATAGGGADTITDFVVGTDRIDVSAFGSIVGVTQQGADALVTVAAGVTFLLLNTTASAVTGASFIGLPSTGYNEIVGTAAGEALNGTAAADHIQGLGGNDTIHGLDQNDVLDGGDADDNLYGDAGDDTLNGGGGADRLEGGLGADALVGGAGNDVYIVQDAGDTVTELANEGNDEVFFSGVGSYTLGANVENGHGLSSTGQTLIGNGGFNYIMAGSGADTLRGEGGADYLSGGAGADTFVATLNGGADQVADFLVGTDKLDVSAFGAYQSIVQQGADTLVTVSAGVSFLLLGITASTVTAASFVGIAPTGYNVITGTAATESLTGTTAADHIFGLGGIDTIRGGDSADWIEGGDDDDRLYGDGGNDLIQGGDGADQAFGRLGDDEIDGGAGADKLYGDEGADDIVGGVGADYLYGGADNDVLSGGDDVDRLYGDDGDDVIDGDAGNDIIQGGAGDDRITGGAGNDTITGGAGADVHVATLGGGADTVIDFVVGTDRIDLTAFGGYQTIAQVNGDTVITFATGVTMKLIGVTASALTEASFIGLPLPPTYNLINGTGAAETLNGTAAADEIHGLAGADILIGGAADDLLVGGADGDTFVATVGGGADTVGDFTVGSDRIDVSAFGSIVGVTQQGADALVTVSAGVTFLLLGVSAGAVGADSFIGLPAGPLFNEINGTAANETINGTASADHVLAGDGTDRVYGAGGGDWLEGGLGSDLLYGDGGDDLLEGGDGVDQIWGGLGLDTANGGAANDKLYGEDGDDTLNGDAGGDFLYGGDGLDTLNGGDDVDRLYGDAGADVLNGGLGNDLIYGGAGSDVMTGGGGNDTFYILGEGDFGPLGAPDRITDWNAGDKINLTAVDANTGLAGDQAFAIVSAFTNAAGQLVSTYNGGTNETLVEMDVNGDGLADYSLIVGGQITAAGWVL